MLFIFRPKPLHPGVQIPGVKHPQNSGSIQDIIQSLDNGNGNRRLHSNTKYSGVDSSSTPNNHGYPGYRPPIGYDKIPPYTTTTPTPNLYKPSESNLYNPQTNNFYHPKVEVKKPFTDRNYFEVHLKDPYTNFNSEKPHQQSPTNVQTYPPPSSPNYSSNQQTYLSNHPQNQNPHLQNQSVYPKSPQQQPSQYPSNTQYPPSNSPPSPPNYPANSQYPPPPSQHSPQYPLNPQNMAKYPTTSSQYPPATQSRPSYYHPTNPPYSPSTPPVIPPVHQNLLNTNPYGTSKADHYRPPPQVSSNFFNEVNKMQPILLNEQQHNKPTNPGTSVLGYNNDYKFYSLSTTTTSRPIQYVTSPTNYESSLNSVVHNFNSASGSTKAKPPTFENSYTYTKPQQGNQNTGK